MSKCDALLQKARDTRKKGLRFDEAIKLAECYDFHVVRQRGSHVMMKRDGFPTLLNFQPRADGKAKAAQVGQLLDAIEEISG